MELEGKKKQKHFVLVHGACHGAWCWYKVVTRLRSVGHRITALDMAAAGANTKRVEELSSFSDYCRPLVELMEAVPPEEMVVLVGHSMGGICLSLAMEKFPDKISLAVFVAAYMPGPDFNVLAALGENQRRPTGFYMDCRLSFANETINLQHHWFLVPILWLNTCTNFHLLRLAISSTINSFSFILLYLICSTVLSFSLDTGKSTRQDLTLATLLVRPVATYGGPSLLHEVALTKENYGSIRRVYVVCERDNIVNQNSRLRTIQLMR